MEDCRARKPRRALGRATRSYGLQRRLAQHLVSTLLTAWLARRRAWRGLPVGLGAIALAMTIGEPRPWEYGGSDGAQLQFDNESLDVGQLHEIRAF
jgi:hypothetical protein